MYYEMYYDIFTNQKEILFLMQMIDRKNCGRQIEHAYILFVKCMHTF